MVSKQKVEKTLVMVFGIDNLYSVKYYEQSLPKALILYYLRTNDRHVGTFNPNNRTGFIMRKAGVVKGESII